MFNWLKISKPRYQNPNGCPDCGVPTHEERMWEHSENMRRAREENHKHMRRLIP